jgi:prolyl-tRNA synthetase
MKISKLFTSTSKLIGDEIKSKSHQLLVRGGFINQEMAGAYSILPLGYKVLSKIENIIRKEMNSIGSQEVLMPALHPKDNWIKTERWNNLDVLFKVKSQWGNTEYALGPTHEEIVVPLVGKFLSSYKDLPISVYQIQSKFRDEKRAKSGIIRGREFRMKDMYSFHENSEDLSLYYEKVKKSYIDIFKNCGIDSKVTKASGGCFTKKYSHEFMAISEAGEDLIYSCDSCSYAENSEVSNLKEKTRCPECKDGIVTIMKAIEIGNIFDLGEKFAKDFNLFYTDKDGAKKIPVCGCYGIGTTRLIGAITEVNNDDKGIIWPKSVAPFQVYLIGLNKTEKETNLLYNSLIKNNIDVLYDDREDKNPGEKFADADLIGIPIRIVLSEKTLKNETVEFKNRNTNEIEMILLSNLIEKIKNESN